MIPQNHRSHLTNLVWLGSAAVTLQVNHFLHTRPAKDVVAAFHPLLESELFQEGTELVKTDSRI
jgi:hypothetical protein